MWSRKTDMSFMTAKNIMWHWKNNTKESEKIRFIDVFTAERIIADRKRFSKALIVTTQMSEMADGRGNFYELSIQRLRTLYSNVRCLT